MPVLEAMTYGVPVVASNTSALPEVCGDAALLVDPNNTDQLKDALCRMANQPELREKYVGRGLARTSQFNWETAVEKTWEIYRELLS